jgi:TPR repeat protein
MNLVRSACLVVALVLSSGTVATAQDIDKGFVAYQAGDFVTALEEWRPLAEQGDAIAQYNLGLMYEDGAGVLQDDAEAVKWYQLAAEQGLVLAQNNLGNMYYNGQGVLQDYSEAVRWYRLAAEQGNARAQFFLGLMYFTGDGALKSNVLAHMWYNIASANGNSESGEWRDKTADLMTATDISLAQQMASECMSSNYQNCGG